MDPNERMLKLLQAPEEVLAKIDAILEGRDEQPCDRPENVRLLPIMEAARRLGITYSKIYRIIGDGLLDVVDATGRRMIRESSVIEFSKGERHPSKDVLERREARNAARREEYRRLHPKVV